MTKAEVISEVGKRTGINRPDIQLIIENFFKVIKAAMIRGENVYFRGFGSFIIKKKARKVARNITKNTTIIIHEHYAPSFKPAKVFLTEIKHKVII